MTDVGHVPPKYKKRLERLMLMLGSNDNRCNVSMNLIPVPCQLITNKSMMHTANLHASPAGKEGLCADIWVQGFGEPACKDSKIDSIAAYCIMPPAA